MEARRLTVAADVLWEDVVQPTEAAEVWSEVSVILPPTELNVILTAAETSAVILTTTKLPSSSPTAPSTDTAGGPQ